MRGSGRPLSRPSSRYPWSSAWQSSSTPSTILLSAAINTKPIPRLGGTAVFLGLVVACTVQILGTWYLGWPPVLVPRPRLHISYPILALSFTVIFATGAIDDVFQLTPKQKLAGQVLAALIACMGGLRIGVIVNPFAPGEIMLGWLALPHYRDLSGGIHQHH